MSTSRVHTLEGYSILNTKSHARSSSDFNDRKIYALFAGTVDSARGGWKDFAGTFDSIAAAKAAYDTQNVQSGLDWGHDWGHVVDLLREDIVAVF